MSLAGKLALVTGSTSGIGLGIADALAAQGANLLLNGFGEEDAISTVRAALAVKYGITVGYHGADLGQPAAIEALMQHATSLGGVDVLVNNAGIQHVASIEDFPVDRWDAVLAINLSSSFHTMRLALPTMRQRGWGRVINVASAHGLVASANKAAYVAAKHGLLGLTKVAGLETARTGVTVNAICPGWVLTPLVQQQIEARAAAEGKSVEQAKHDLLAEKQPSLEFVTPAQLGALAVFLCSDAAQQIRGAAYSVDGGWVAQ